MSKQLTATIVVDGQVDTSTVSFLTDLIFISESTGTGSVNSIIHYFGNPIDPTEAVTYKATETVSSLVSSSSNALVQATIWENNVSKQCAFPVGGYKIEESTGDADINSIITYRGNTYAAEETLSELVDAANAGDGSVSIGGTYDNNADAVAALGTGQLYKSSTLINDSPIILITV